MMVLDDLVGLFVFLKCFEEFIKRSVKWVNFSLEYYKEKNCFNNNFFVII